MTGIPAEQLLRLTTLNLNNAPDEVERRTGLVCDELDVLAPAILCLQEIQYQKGGRSLQLEAIAATGLELVTGRGQTFTKYGILSGGAIMSSLPVLEAGPLEMDTPDTVLPVAEYAVLLAATGQAVITISAHLAWGGDKEGVRLTQAAAINRRVLEFMDQYREMHPVAVLAGDMNTQPGSDTYRYLSGQGAGADGGYTFWTEAFATAGRSEEAATVAGDNYWAQKTARGVGITYPDLLPDRRIDYVWTHGWAYGRPGCPVTVRRSFTDTTRYGFSASDHYGLSVDLWMPPVLAPEPAIPAAANRGLDTGAALDQPAALV